MRRPSVGTVVAASLLGLLAGLIQPLMLSASVLFVTGSVIAPVLYAWAGITPALIFLAVSAGCLNHLFGAGVAAAGLLLFGVPSVAAIALMARRSPYFVRMRAVIGAQLGAMLALILILYAGLGRDLADVVVEWLTAQADGMPPQFVALMLQQFAYSGALSQELTSQVLSGTLTAAQQLEALHGVFNTLGDVLRLTLPARLVSSGLVTGIFATLLPGKICSRRGDDLEYVPVSGWFIPKQLSVGLLVCLATALILHWTKVDGSESVLNAILTAAGVAFEAAGAASLSRSLKERGRGMAFRVALIGLGLLLIGQMIMLIGVMSILFGRRGLISTYIKQKRDEHKGDDEL